MTNYMLGYTEAQAFNHPLLPLNVDYMQGWNSGKQGIQTQDNELKDYIEKEMEAYTSVESDDDLFDSDNDE